MIRTLHSRVARSAGSILLALLAAGIGFASPLFASSPARTSAPSAIPASGDAPTITYRKVFKSSYPEFVEIKLNESGRGTFDMRQLDEEANPQPFEVNASLAARIFALAAKLHNFQGVDLDVHRRIANLGEKTLRYDKGAETHEVK